MITNQAYLFLIFCVNGIIIGLLFDFFRILRRSFKTKDIITYMEDILFGILTGSILLYSIFTFNNGEIRLFILLGVALGIIFYMLLISSYIIKINVAIIRFLKKIFSKILHILAIPFKAIYQIIRKIFFKPISFVIINIRNFSTNLFKNTYHNLKNIKKSKKCVKNWK